MSSHLEEPATPTVESPGSPLAGSPLSEWNLCLYVLGHSPQSEAAVRNLRRICETHLFGRYQIEVIDLLETPRLSRDHQIVAIPTLVRKLPGPIRKIIGDLSDTERTLVGLELKAASRMRHSP